MSSKVISKFGSHVKELRLHLCLSGDSSEGVRYSHICLMNWTSICLIYREFVGKHYRSVKQSNPNLPILIREAKGIEPKLWARFGLNSNKLFTNFD